MARILIVDDDPQIRRMLRLLLEANHHHVHEAADGRTALRLAAQEPVDAFFCDVFMADHDGLETMQDFRHAFPGIPIIAMSGGGFGGLLDMLPAARSLGADRVLYKPFGQASLLAVLDGLLPPSSAVRGQRSEVRGQKSEVRSQGSAVAGDILTSDL